MDGGRKKAYFSRFDACFWLSFDLSGWAWFDGKFQRKLCAFRVFASSFHKMLKLNDFFL